MPVLNKIDLPTADVDKVKEEIEAVIGAVPGVWECAVVGVEDAAFGERPVAFVVPHRDSDLDALRAEISDAVGRNLGRIKRPDAIHFIAELPRTPTGKLLRRQLRSTALGVPPAR